MTATARRGEMVIWRVRYKVSKFLVQKRYSSVTKWRSERPFRKGFIYVLRTCRLRQFSGLLLSLSLSFSLSFTLCFASPLHRTITNRSGKEPRQRLYRNFTQRKRRRRGERRWSRMRGGHGAHARVCNSRAIRWSSLSISCQESILPFEIMSDEDVGIHRPARLKRFV